VLKVVCDFHHYYNEVKVFLLFDKETKSVKCLQLNSVVEMACSARASFAEDW